MKKLFIFAVAAAMLVGCNNDDQTGSATTDGNAVGFRPVITKNTRATEATAANIKDFKAFGAWTGSVAPANTFDFMYGTNVVRGTGSTWTYSPLAYWPATGTVDFYAFSPAGSRGIVSVFDIVDADPIIEYAVPTDKALQEDFLVAKAEGLDKEDHTGEVQLTFDHALAQLVFQARSALKDVVFNIEAIEITGLQTNGELDLSDVASGWDLATNVTPAFADYSAPIFTTQVNYTASTTKYNNVTGPNDGLMVMPQTLTKLGNGTDTTPEDGIPDDYAADATTIYLVVTYGAQQVNDGAQIVASGTKVYLPLTAAILNGEFLMGKKYIFQLTMNTGITPVVFNVLGVNDWDVDIDGDGDEDDDDVVEI